MARTVDGSLPPIGTAANVGLRGVEALMLDVLRGAQALRGGTSNHLAPALVKNATAATPLHQFSGGNRRTAAAAATTQEEAGAPKTMDIIVEGQ